MHADVDGPSPGPRPNPEPNTDQVPTVYADVALYDLRRNSWTQTTAVGSELLVAVSAPTALAITFAGQAGMTLVGFARPGRHNVYTFPERIMDSGETTHDV